MAGLVREKTVARVLAGFIAILIGVVATLFGIWIVLGGSEAGEQSVGWTAIMALFMIPIFVMAMSMGILFLEGLANWTKRPRVQVLIWGSILIPLGLAVLIGGPYMIGALAGFDGARHAIAPALIIAAGAIAPCFITCCVYALLSRRTRDA